MMLTGGIEADDGKSYLLATGAVGCAAASGALAAGAAPAGVVGCHHHADFNLLVSSARNMSCTAAKRELRRYRGSISRSFRTPGGVEIRIVREP